MPYWGPRPDENDFAFDAIGAYAYLIKERLFSDMAVAIDKAYPEQAIVASVKCLRLLAQEFPKCVSLHFRRRQLEDAKAGFERWYSLVGEKLPDEISAAIREEADAEFEMYEEQILSRANS